MSIREKLHVMVVDDMSTSRGLLTQGLESLGVVNQRDVNDGKTAFDMISRQPVHLVISDYNMPGMDGLQLLEKLRRQAHTQKIAFILVTGKLTQDVIAKSQALGVNSILKKPFTKIELKDSIEKVVGRL